MKYLHDVYLGNPLVHIVLLEYDPMFVNRTEAGRTLATTLRSYPPVDLVLGLARGGVVVSKAIADALGVPQDVLVVKKIGSPGNPELAIGAVASGGITYIDEELARTVGADREYINDHILDLNNEIQHKMGMYRKGKPPLIVRGKKVIIADDGSATGATMYAAIQWAKTNGAKSIIVALPVAPKAVVANFRELVEDVCVLETPTDFGAVGELYREFPQRSDQDVIKLLT